MIENIPAIGVSFSDFFAIFAVLCYGFALFFSNTNKKVRTMKW